MFNANIPKWNSIKCSCLSLCRCVCRSRSSILFSHSHLGCLFKLMWVLSECVSIRRSGNSKQHINEQQIEANKMFVFAPVQISYACILTCNMWNHFWGGPKRKHLRRDKVNLNPNLPAGNLSSRLRKEVTWTILIAFPVINQKILLCLDLYLTMDTKFCRVRWLIATKQHVKSIWQAYEIQPLWKTVWTIDLCAQKLHV